MNERACVCMRMYVKVCFCLFVPGSLCEYACVYMMYECLRLYLIKNVYSVYACLRVCVYLCVCACVGGCYFISLKLPSTPLTYLTMSASTMIVTSLMLSVRVRSDV